MNFKQADGSALNGTSLQGYCPPETTYQRLVAALGEPHTDGDGYKVDAEWVLQFEDGTVATVYNYKSGPNYCGAEGTPVDQLVGSDWHIGGRSETAVDRVVELLSQERTNAVPFKYYLHDSYQSNERADWITQQTGVTIDDDLNDKMGRPFYEVELNCELDTDTGKVTITGVQGVPLAHPV